MGETVPLKKFLVVDDEAAILGSFVDAFDDQFQFVTANSGEEALSVLKAEPDIAVVVTDQRMPGMNGVELLKEIKTAYPEKVRVLITGYTDLNTAINAINQGDVYRYIQKPVDEEETLYILKDALAQYNEHQQIRQSIANVKKNIQNRFIEIFESLSSGIAHHINNGLLPTKTFYELLPQKLSDLKDNKYDKGFFEDFFNQASSDIDCVQQIVAMFTWVRNCRVDDFQPVAMNELFEVENIDIARMVKEKKITVKKEIPAETPKVVVDRLKAQEMLTLLLKNMLKEAPENCQVGIRVQPNTQDPSMPTVRITFIRSGQAYKPEEIPRLFDPFYKFDKSLKDGVTGLDLTHAFIIAAKHGSEIKVESEPDGETSFTVELPASL